MFAGTRAPKNWAYCNGQTIEIAQNTMLYAVIGTTYGGNGSTNFWPAQPAGQGADTSGQRAGIDLSLPGAIRGELGVSLEESQIPAHNHELVVTMNSAASTEPAGLYPSRHMDDSKGLIYKETPSLDAQFADSAVGIAGASQMHENRQPFLTVPFCIAIPGVPYEELIFFAPWRCLVLGPLR